VSPFVADASVGAAWLVSSQSDSETDRLLDAVEAGAGIHVPALWLFEIANTLLVLRRRGRLDENGYNQSRLDLLDLHPRVDDDDHRVTLAKISQLAERHGLSIYDAVYLELALRRALPLASRESALNKAAKRAGVRTLLA
jgi:predicted nucleic acid-binding protein